MSRKIVKIRTATVFLMLGVSPVFVAPRGLTFGNCGRDSLNNPLRTNFNISLLKHFKVLGERDIEFRAEAFNIFSDPRFRIFDLPHPGNIGNNLIGSEGGAAAHYSAAGGGVDCLAGKSFLHPVDAHDPRILQLGLKFAFQRFISGYTDMVPSETALLQ